MSTQIKVCGLTREEDVAAAAAAGADLLGFIHVPKSPRFVDVPRLAQLLRLVPATCKKVVVVQDAAEDLLSQLRQNLDFNWFQFHGSEPPATIARHGGYAVKSIRGNRLASSANRPETPFYLLDTQSGSQQGGTGKTFDWQVLPQFSGKFLVAGGLHPGNISNLITQYQPWGVDVSSGIEDRPGIKNHRLLNQFINIVRGRPTA